MKQLVVALGIVGVGGISSMQGHTPLGTETRPTITASASLIDTAGRGIGEAHLRQSPHGILLELDLEHVAPGVHGLHIHDVGRCERPTFESAGGHVNPAGRQHGFLNPHGPHAGDLPNIEVPSAATLSVDYFVADVTLEPGPRSLLDHDGAAIVIHSGQDDYVSDPAGESGDRLACGPIVRPETR